MDVRRILDQCRIRYVTDGKNTKRGCVSIKCPLCGVADGSEHGNVNLRDGGYFCWRNRGHAMSFKRLIRMMAGPQAAAALDDDEGPPLSGYEAACSAFFAADHHEEQHDEVIDWPDEARVIRPDRVTRPYWDYMFYDRKISHDDIGWACNEYELRCCLYGKHGGRILFPIHEWSGGMIGFYGRAIGNSRLRYRAHPPGPQPKHGIFGLPQAKRGGRRLIVNEGPFDALNLNVYAPKDCYAVSVQTTSITKQQKNILNRLADRFDEVVILLDQQAEEQALMMAGQLLCQNRVALVPEHRKDPGEMDARDAALAWHF